MTVRCRSRHGPANTSPSRLRGLDPNGAGRDRVTLLGHGRTVAALHSARGNVSRLRAAGGRPDTALPRVWSGLGQQGRLATGTPFFACAGTDAFHAGAVYAEAPWPGI